MIYRLLFFFLFLFSLLQAEEKEFPVLYQGRYRPVEAYARLWLYEIYHSPTLKQKDLFSFQTTSSSPLELLWSLEFFGHFPYQKAPLFWIGSADIKRKMGLILKNNRFSLEELQNQQNLKENPSLLEVIKKFEALKKGASLVEESFHRRFAELQKTGIPPKEIGELLEREYPLAQRLKNAGSLFQSLPSRYNQGEWLPLKALKTKVYHSSSNALKNVGNFTLFSDADFENIRTLYLALEKEVLNSSPRIHQKPLSQALLRAYAPLAGKTIQEVSGKKMTYPSLNQLKIEALYVSIPWIPFLILVYAISAILFLISFRIRGSKISLLATVIFCLAAFFHTLLLAMRCYILERPPVSNMFETVLYVPWVGVCLGLFFPFFRKQPLVLLGACLTSIALLLILELTDLNQSLDQVQAVLDSQFWLMVHVLLVVGSYGIFILGAILGHFYLAIFLKNRKMTPSMLKLSEMILQTLYGGTALLITGTILGGVWAAESWGRFWDWDPKESWAFISCCFYLLWIHAYRFHRIGSFGLAVGAVSGCMAISFTWYGVNYILGTGLHSYGFGSGGEIYYYVFLGAESLFLTIALLAYRYFSLQKKTMA